MNTELLTEVAKSGEGELSTTTILLIIFCVGWLLERIFKFVKTQRSGVPTWPEVERRLDSKVNGNECHSFKTRIGKESDEHRKNIADIKEDISEIKEGVAYLKGKAD